MSKQIRRNIIEIDRLIGSMLIDLEAAVTKEEREDLRYEIKELSELRIDLETNLGENSNSEHWIMGGLSLAGIALILHYEKFDVVTSKAISMATKMF